MSMDVLFFQIIIGWWIFQIIRPNYISKYYSDPQLDVPLVPAEIAIIVVEI
jgi:hypothetical protein